MIIAMIVSMMVSLSAIAVSVAYSARQTGMIDEAREAKESVEMMMRNISQDKMSETEARWRDHSRIDDQIEITNKKLIELQALVNEYIKGRVITEGAKVSLKHNSFGMWDIVAVEDSAPEKKEDS